MCGRYSIASNPNTMEVYFLAQFELGFKFEPVYNAAPSLKLPVITCEAPEKIQGFRWGFMPHYEKNINKGLINARSEGVITSKAFLKSIRERRCIVPANCFYEWSQTTPKVPHLIYSEESQLFAFAGIYREWVNKETGETFNTFAILTTAPNKLMEKVKHHRCPVILSHKHYSTWLKKDAPLSKITEILSLTYDKMNAYPVANLVNKPANNTKEIMQPVGERLINNIN